MSGVDVQSADGFRRMYREQLGYVYSVLQRLGAPQTHLEDLCHDVFVIAFRKRADFDSSRPLKPWLFGLAFRHLLNSKRKAVDDTPLESVHPLRSAEPSPEESAMQNQARTVLSHAIAALEPNRRAVFLMHDVDGHGAPDIARELEIPLNTAYSRLRLAREEILQRTEALRMGGNS